MAERRYHIIFNPTAGTALTTGLTTAALSEMFTTAGLSFDIDDDDSAGLKRSRNQNSWCCSVRRVFSNY